MYKVSLSGLKFNCGVGVYAQEKLTGNELEIDLTVGLSTNDSSLLPFIDYVVLHDLLKSSLKQNSTLLEELLRDMLIAIKQYVGEQAKVKLTLKKLYPPINARIESVEVVWDDF